MLSVTSIDNMMKVWLTPVLKRDMYRLRQCGLRKEDGAAEGDRTLDLSLTKDALYH